MSEEMDLRYEERQLPYLPKVAARAVKDLQVCWL